MSPRLAIAIIVGTRNKGELITPKPGSPNRSATYWCVPRDCHDHEGFGHDHLVPRQPDIDKFLGLLSNPGGFDQDYGTESDHEQEVHRAVID
jgi:hypothetical protein